MSIDRRELLLSLALAPVGCRKKASDERAGERGDEVVMKDSTKMPTLYLPHGGGPCFFMEWTMGPRDTWDKMKSWLQTVGTVTDTQPKPKALLVISAHWEESVPTVIGAPQPELLYDYYGFPKHTYELKWPAPGAPEVANRVQALLEQANIPSRRDDSRGLDHGVFIPLKVAYPDADVPTVQLSLRKGLDPVQHLQMGRALAPLRDEGVFIVGSGMSYHNMRRFNSAAALADSQKFDTWLAEAARKPRQLRDDALANWASAPAGRACHPREEHLLPLMVVAGAAGEDLGTRVFVDTVMGAQVSAISFGRI